MKDENFEKNIENNPNFNNPVIVGQNMFFSKTKCC